MQDRLIAVIDFKADREARAGRDLRDALDVFDQQQALVDAHRESLGRERVDVQLAWLGDLADARARDALKKAEQQLQQASRAVDDARARHRQAAMEHQAVVRLYERRREEARRAQEKREQCGFDEIAARLH